MPMHYKLLTGLLNRSMCPVFMWIASPFIGIICECKCYLFTSPSHIKCIIYIVEIYIIPFIPGIQTPHIDFFNHCRHSRRRLHVVFHLLDIVRTILNHFLYQFRRVGVFFFLLVVNRPTNRSLDIIESKRKNEAFNVLVIHERWRFDENKKRKFHGLIKKIRWSASICNILIQKRRFFFPGKFDKTT